MTEADKPSVDQKSATIARLARAHVPGSRRRIPITTIIVFSLILFGFYSAFLVLRMHLVTSATVAPDATTAVMQMEQRLAADEEKIDALQTRLDQAETKTNISPTASPEAPAEPQPLAVDAQTTTRLQNDFASLSAAVVALQDGMKQVGNTATEIWHSAQSRIAASIAFVQLRADADAGRPFTSDVAALRAAAGNDANIQGQLAVLDPYAETGVMGQGALHDQFEALEGPVSVALDKAAADDWEGRLFASLEGLVHFHRVHGTTVANALTLIDNDLLRGNLPAARDTAKTLPSEAQNLLKDWLARLEARIAVDQALQSLAGHYAAPPEAAQDQK